VLRVIFHLDMDAFDVAVELPDFVALPMRREGSDSV